GVARPHRVQVEVDAHAARALRRREVRVPVGRHLTSVAARARSGGNTRRRHDIRFALVRLELGPLPSASVIAWIEDVNAVLEDVESGRTNFPFVVSPESIATTRRLLLSCYIRCGSETFNWSTTHVDPDVAVVQLHYWLTL